MANGLLLDTDEPSREVWLDLVRRRPFGQKLQDVSELSDLLWAAQRAGILLRYPHASEEEVLARIAVLRLGRELAAKVVGSLPQD